MVELGFEQPQKQAEGVCSAASFTWTILWHKWRLHELIGLGRKVVVDEYRDEYTAAEFLNGALAMVAIEYQYPREFS